mmetsp:Transcript_84394/g.272791  ORF Transcript_84394/g.272791 Transcript_84394/m.272791 type:complete len:245 (-) Transcript_84394:65-799(-)
MVTNEGTTHCDLLRRCQPEGVLCAHEAALDLHQIIPNNPILAISVEARPSPIEGDDVRVTPENTLLRLWLRVYYGLHGCGRCGGRHEKHGHDPQHKEGDQGEARHEVTLRGRHDREVPPAAANELVGRLSDPVSMTITDQGHGPSADLLTTARAGDATTAAKTTRARATPRAAAHGHAANSTVLVCLHPHATGHAAHWHVGNSTVLVCHVDSTRLHARTTGHAARHARATARANPSSAGHASPG